MRLAIVLVGVIGVCVTACSQQEQEPTLESMDRETWVARMQVALPTLFCADGTFFRECFSVSPEECVQAARPATNRCLTDLQGSFPATLTLPDEGREWGQKVGECAGTVVEATLVGQKIGSPECSNHAVWR